MSTIRTVEHKSYVSRMGNAACGACFGLVLFIVAFPLIFWNEHEVVAARAALDEAGRLLIEAPADRPDPALVGKLIHITGPVTVGRPATDATYGIAPPRALKVERKVESYQTVEHKSSHTRKTSMGGEETITEYSYAEEWRNALVASSSFQDSSKRGRNPSSWRHFSPDGFRAGSVRVGSYAITPAAIEQLGSESGGEQPVDLLDAGSSTLGKVLLAISAGEGSGAAALPHPDDVTPLRRALAPAITDGSEGAAAGSKRSKKGKGGESSTALVSAALEEAGPNAVAVAQTLQGLTLHRNTLYAGTGGPLAPVVGDSRVTWTVKTAPEYASVLGKQLPGGGGIGAFRTSSGREILLAGDGHQSPEELLDTAHSRESLKAWLIRAGSWLLMLVGILMVLQPITVAPDLVPFIGGFLSGVAKCGVWIIAFATATSSALITIALAWFTARPLLSVALIAVGVGSWYLLSRASGAGRKAQPAPAAPGPASSASYRTEGYSAPAQGGDPTGEPYRRPNVDRFGAKMD